MHVPGWDQRRDVTAVQGALGGQAQFGPAVLMADRVPPLMGFHPVDRGDARELWPSMLDEIAALAARAPTRPHSL